MRFLIWKIIFLFIFFPTISNAEKRFDSQKASISLSVPDNWVKIPPETMELMHKALRQKSKMMKFINYVDGYQLDQNKALLDYPYILIQVDLSGRISEEELLKSKNMQIDKEIFDSIENDLSELVLENSTSSSNMIYDENINAYWFFVNITMRTKGLVKGISNIYPTEIGQVAIHCYFLEKNTKKFASVCHSILKSVSIHKNIKYRPKSKFKRMLPFLFPKTKKQN